MTIVQSTGPGVSGEIQLTDAIATLIAEESVYAYRFVGQSYDCGHKLGFVQANAEYALKDPEVGADFERLLRRRLEQR